MSRHPRGFTLIELLVAMLISAVVLVGVVAVVNAQQQAYYDGQRQREAQGNGRSALTFIEQALLMAGYGMDAPLAFDFDRYTGPCPSAMGTCPRDSVSNSDEIVFYNRNPRYWVPDSHTAEPRGAAWRITGLAGTSVSVNARQGDTFLNGQILQAVCRAAGLYAYFTVSTNTTAGADGSLSIPLLASASSDPFRRQDAATDSCFTSGEARLFLIERHRFHVRPVGTESYLVHDLGIDVNQDGTIDANDELIVAGGVEILQFAYVLTNPGLAPRGLTPGTPIAFAKGAGGSSANGMATLDFPGTVPAGTFTYLPTSWYSYTLGPPAAAARMTDHQANIRAVQVAIRARSTLADTRTQGADGEQLPLFNLNALPSWFDRNDRYGRVTFISTVPIRNMVVRGMVDF